MTDSNHPIPAPAASAGQVTTRRPGPRRPRRWIPYAGAILLIGLIGFGLWPQPVIVETAPAQSRRLRATIEEEGKTRVRQRYVVSAPIAGVLRRIEWKAGAYVEGTNTILAIIDPLPPPLLDARHLATAQARRDAAAAQLDKAQVTQSQAERDLRRAEELYAQRAVSIQELEAAQSRERAASQDVSAAKGSYNQAVAELEQFSSGSSHPADSQPPVQVHSPTQGHILRVLQESSRPVTPGTALLEIGDTSQLEVVIEVLSPDAAMIRKGTPVELTHWGGNVPLQAAVRLIEPGAFTKVSALGVEEQRVNVVADIHTPQEGRGNLGDGFRVEAKIITWEQDNVLAIPTGAIYRIGPDPAVFRVRDGRAQPQKVRLGHRGEGSVEVLEGLQAGDEIILYPGERVKAGVRVRVANLGS